MSKFSVPDEKGKDVKTDTIGKPAKPYPDFPLFPHATRRWAKKIRGRLHYFGPWEDPQGAIHRYLDQKDALHSGRRPTVKPDAVTMYDLAVAFLQFKKNARDAGELTLRSFNEYTTTTKRVLKAFGKHQLIVDLNASDFERLRASWTRKGWGPSTVSNEVQRVRTLFKYAIDIRLVDRLIHFGPGFKKPSKKVMRLNRAAKGRQMFEPCEIAAMLFKALPAMRAMVLLGINCGFGNSDIGKLPISAVNLTTGWLDFSRPKTGVPRRCWLWPETVEAVRGALAVRREPAAKQDAGLLFITKYGESWFKDSRANPLSREFSKLAKDAGVKGARGFYCLRRTFETIGGETKDQVAVDAVMGHIDDTMSGLYRQDVSDERLRAVTQKVRDWLFGANSAK
jgi:integrase